ncbi:MBL fold metallo-hydrolase [Chitinophaga nivalis]|uniref:MBL fold metallo-hydrolase n=1 Tax=Chitinophaga nivalis TaxID=2991709 RepID=A0ABT3IGT9_9BACT|nr:MBL fold metallo-hydrolase [Chitinophaga nivalis]MCW3467145.1 MBL fold metallo-hydrolase [Chitinophaga nivalis]MCW3483164.1 MBL fold metallo-hydrolase [Chitinophaga nivalis]
MTTNAQSFKTIDATPLQLQVYAAPETSFGVASVIVSGKTDAILIDAQFTLPEARKVVEAIKASGKKLTTIFISHGDPDFYFGLEEFKRAFPGVTVYATAATVDHIKATAQKKLEVWGPQLGENGTKNVVLPQVLNGNSLELEGNKLDIVSVPEVPGRTFVWIPSIKAVVGGINVFGTGFHLWVADAASAEKRHQWVTVLDKIESLHPAIVIPAHFKEGAALDIASVQYDKAYLKTYEAELAKAKTSAALIAAMKKHYPAATFETALQLGAKVNTGEMKW